MTVDPAFLYRRKVVLTRPLEGDTGLSALRSLDGMVEVSARDATHLWLRYDASQVQIDTVLERLRAFGHHASWTGLARWRLGWYRFVDANSYRNARSQDLHCCNQPPRRPPP